jgi:hypothetical protein
MSWFKELAGQPLEPPPVITHLPQVSGAEGVGSAHAHDPAGADHLASAKPANRPFLACVSYH